MYMLRQIVGSFFSPHSSGNRFAKMKTIRALEIAYDREQQKLAALAQANPSVSLRDKLSQLSYDFKIQRQAIESSSADRIPLIGRDRNRA